MQIYQQTIPEPARTRRLAIIMTFCFILYAIFITQHREYPVHRRMVSSGMLRRVALVRTDVSEDLSAYFIRVTRVGELGTDARCEEISSQLASVASYS
jgi:hypothetical protein